MRSCFGEIAHGIFGEGGGNGPLNASQKWGQCLLADSSDARESQLVL